MSSSASSARSTPSVSAAEYRYRPWPASSWTLAMRIALRRSDGARVIQLPSGCIPMISECACCAICRISVLRYGSGIQSRGSMRPSSSTRRSNTASGSSHSISGPPLGRSTRSRYHAYRPIGSLCLHVGQRPRRTGRRSADPRVRTWSRPRAADRAQGHGQRSRHRARWSPLHARGHRLRLRVQRVRARGGGAVRAHRVPRPGPRGRRARGRRDRARPRRPQRDLRRDRAATVRRHADRGVPRAQPVPARMTTRERLSLEAARMFPARGYHGTSIGDLAGALGIQKASVYSHISGKHDLLAEAALAGAVAFHAAQDAVPADVAPAERIRLALAAHLTVVSEQLDVAGVWLQEWRYLEGDPRREFLRERHRYEERIRALFTDASADGELRGDLDAVRAALTFLSLGNWAYEWLTPEHDVAGEADALATLMLDG